MQKATSIRDLNLIPYGRPILNHRSIPDLPFHSLTTLPLATFNHSVPDHLLTLFPTFSAIMDLRPEWEADYKCISGMS